MSENLLKCQDIKLLALKKNDNTDNGKIHVTLALILAAINYGIVGFENYPRAQILYYTWHHLREMNIVMDLLLFGTFTFLPKIRLYILAIFRTIFEHI